MSDAGEDFIYVRERRLPYTTFDADNHLYETKDALTKFLPREYQGVMKYVEVDGRTKPRSATRSASTSPTPPSHGWRCRAATAVTSPRATAGPLPATRISAWPRCGRCRASKRSSIRSPASSS